MTALEQKVYHDCPVPDVPDREAEYRWTCECGTAWTFWPQTPTTDYRRYGFLWHKLRVTHGWYGGGWSHHQRTSEWQPVTT